MTSSLLQLIVVCVGLFLLQGVAALPWVVALSGRPLRRQGGFVLSLLGGLAAAGVAAAFFLNINSDRDVLGYWGRIYGSVLHLQLALDLFVLVFAAMLLGWSKGGAVALASFREGVRQPMFWLLTGAGALAMAASVWVPYFTFGEDLKMVKELCYDFTMLAAGVFGVMAASISVSEEIEGRTAVTLLSKPISRRQFLLGKFAGISLAALLMTVLLGWFMVWAVLYKGWLEANIPGTQENTGDPAWVLSVVESLFARGTAADLLRGIGLWAHDAGGLMPGLVIGFCQVMVFVATGVALATRLPMVVNVTVCLVVYFLGHLTPILSEVTRHSYPLVHFVAQLFGLLLPGLDLFNVGSAVVRDIPLDPVSYSFYTLNVALYALIYTGIALLLGLILFEDRDVA
jgi:ABC-type transport system involved in multi-copper enzyme maturation permease subunit